MVGSSWAGRVVAVAAAAVIGTGAVIVGSTGGSSNLPASITATATGTATSCTGANVTTATFSARVSASAAGDVLCLADGSYGTWTGANKTSPGITLKAINPSGPKMLVNFSTGANWLTLDGVYIGTGSTGDHRSSIDWGASHITIKNSEVAGYTVIETSTVNMSTTIGPGNTFTYAEDPTGSFVPSHFEGRLSINGDPGGNDGQTATGLLITGNTFGPGGCADGIQANTGGFTVTGNTFTGLRQGSCNPHVDSMQFYAGPNGGYYNFTATNNVFTDNASGIVDYDSSAHNATISNNGFYNVPSSNDGFFDPCGAICLKGTIGVTIKHNTVIPGPGDTSHNKVQVGTNSQCRVPDTALVRDNVLENAVDTSDAVTPPCGGSTTPTNYTEDHNFCQLGTCPGTGSLSSAPAPSFVSSTPATLADFALTGGSRGTGVASDGTNLGVNP